MPRKTKEEKEEIKIVEKNATRKKVPKKTSSTSTKKVSKIDNSSKSTRSKKTDTKKVTSKKSTAKKTTKSDTAKKATSKSTKKKTVSSKKLSSNSILEYYDLPYRYNQTTVKILAQTPTTLFIYWDISDADRKAFEEHYGKDFFKVTKPVLIVHNETMNYSFEIEINDFANSWYLHVKDPDCKYNIELGRRPYTYAPSISEQYIYVSSSNEMDMPNNHILFEKFNPNVTYKNVKSNTTTQKDFSNMSYKNMKKLYNIYNLYKEIYKDELFNEITNGNILNPSSGSSSSFK